MMRVLSLTMLFLAGVAAESHPIFGDASDSASTFNNEVSAAHKRSEEDKAAATADDRLRSRAQQKAAKTKAAVSDLADALGGLPPKHSAHSGRRIARHSPGRWTDSAEAERMEIEARSEKPRKLRRETALHAQEPVRRQVDRGRKPQEPMQEPAQHRSTTASPRREKVAGMVKDLGDATGVERKTPAQWVPTASHPARPKNPHSNEPRMPTMDEEKQHAATLKLKVPESHPRPLTAADKHDAETPTARSAETKQVAAPVVSPVTRSAPAAVTFDPRTKSWVPVAEPNSNTPAAPRTEAQPPTLRADPRALKKGCHWGDIFC